ncbi:hypothetical protein OGAPHI_003571 [Ogataea philodendri]|uniref:CAP-Gly domain-containing protein n=1 Tax=Ogataea philodendri TaxID=1378263 RepID=A0A9P8P561_9ASCO|nr:uncharacterized protein OGAPHI_003571 [Ogataea philodendri]KAH3665387.1 hypothetical protein OGAPHI_003571 [Ogataea philodendri]
MDYISVFVTSDLTSSERRISLNWTVDHLRQRLEWITGIPGPDQIIYIYRTGNTSERQKIAETDTHNTLTTYSIVPHTRIHVDSKDTNSVVNDLEKDFQNNSDSTEHYRITEEKYRKLDNSVLRWKQNNNLGEYDRNYALKRDKYLQENAELSKQFHVGQGCSVLTSSTDTSPISEKRGVIRFIGKVEEIDEGFCEWIGIELDNKLGKNDGSIRGSRFLLSMFDLNNIYESFTQEFDIFKSLRLVVIIGGYIFFRQRYLAFMKQYQVKKKLEEDRNNKSNELIERPGEGHLDEAVSSGISASDGRWGWGKRTRNKVKSQQKLLQSQLEYAATKSTNDATSDSDDEINELLEE